MRRKDRERDATDQTKTATGDNMAPGTAAGPKLPRQVATQKLPVSTSTQSSIAYVLTIIISPSLSPSPPTLQPAPWTHS
jgi:hypothetical protein